GEGGEGGQGLGGAERGGPSGVNVLVEAGRLAAEGTPFALATVVGVERPSSARVGDRALVTSDGELRGWVGGACTEPEVVRLALVALADGGARRERLESRRPSEGAGEADGAAAAGAVPRGRRRRTGSAKAA